MQRSLPVGILLAATFGASAAPPAPRPASPPTSHDLSARLAPDGLPDAVTSTTVTLDLPVDIGDGFAVDVPIDGAVRRIVLAPHNVRGDDYRLLAEVAPGTIVELTPGPARTLRGVVEDWPGSRVGGSLLEDGLHLRVEPGGDEAPWWVEPTGAGNGHLVYRTEGMPAPGNCATEGEPTTEPAEGGVAGTCQNPYWVTELGIDCDFEYFTLLNSNVGNVESQVESIINTVNMQYEDECQITHVISALIIRTTSDDPYSGTDDFNSLLAQFRSEWQNQQSGTPHDVAHLFTGRDLAGSVIGVASAIGAICTPNKYCLSQNISGFACKTDLTAHELGHLWNGSHCGCPSYTMNPSLTCSNQFNPLLTIPDIVAHRDSRPCIENLCLPSNNKCPDALVVGDGVYDFDTEFATTNGPNESACAGSALLVSQDIWYRYFSPCEGPVDVSLCGAGYDSRLAIYEGFCPGTVNQAIACADGGCGNDAALSFQASFGQWYYIRVGGNDTGGVGSLSILGPGCPPVPLNDTCGAAFVLVEGDTPFSTTGAFQSGPAETCGDPSLDVWYRFTAECDGTASFDACDADFDVTLTVYEGSLCPDADDTAIACGACSLEAPVTAGEIYRVRVGSDSGGSGSGMLAFSCTEGPPCATDVDGNGATDVGDLVAVVLDWGTDGSANGGDVDASGLVDVSDLVAVVLAWGPCP